MFNAEKPLLIAFANRAQSFELPLVHAKSEDELTNEVDKFLENQYRGITFEVHFKKHNLPRQPDEYVNLAICVSRSKIPREIRNDINAKRTTRLLSTAQAFNKLREDNLEIFVAAISAVTDSP